MTAWVPVVRTNPSNIWRTLRDVTPRDGRRPFESPSFKELPMWGGGSGLLGEHLLDRGVDIRGRMDAPITARP